MKQEYLQLRALGPPGLLLLIPQHPPENLTARALRNDVDELNTALKPLMPSLVVLDVLGNCLRHMVLGMGRGMGAPDDVGLGDFASAVVGDLDDGAVGDELVGEEVGLELSGGDLVALQGR